MTPRTRIARAAPAELAVPEALLDELAAHYADPPRHYHARLDAGARDNLRRRLARLAAATPPPSGTGSAP